MDKLSVTERRLKILEYLIIKKQTTRYELSREFNVSVYTIGRDVIYLSSIAPVYTLEGNGGGICILPQYSGYKIYLTDEEEKCLERVMNIVQSSDKYILKRIIIKFSRYRK